MILDLQESWGVKRLCRVFDVHRSSYCYWRQKRTSLRPDRINLVAEMHRLFRLSNGSAGSRTLVSLLSDSGFRAGRWLVSKLMKQEGLVSRQPPHHKPLRGGREHLGIPNVLNRNFSPDKPNQIWTGDVTYVWAGSCWLYLAVVIDLYSRRVVGWACSRNPDSELTEKALRMSFESRKRPKGLLFHSDQGCHYTSKSFRSQLWSFKIRQSLSRRGNCWDNSPTERFFRSFKTEWMPGSGYFTYEAAESSIASYINGYYNRHRPHQHNGGCSPMKAEENL